jgi:hypothetical protein
MSETGGSKRRWTRVAWVLRRLGAALAPIPVCDLCGTGVAETCLMLDPMGRIHGLCSHCAESATWTTRSRLRSDRNLPFRLKEIV